MKVTVLLADSGQSDPSGKTHVLGLGWTIIDAPTAQPMAVLVLVNFDGQAEAAGSHRVLLRLMHDDDSPFEIPGTNQPLVLAADMNMEFLDEEVVKDAPATAPFLVNIGPGLPLEPGRRYLWVAEVDGRSDQCGDVPFVTRTARTSTE